MRAPTSRSAEGAARAAPSPCIRSFPKQEWGSIRRSGDRAAGTIPSMSAQPRSILVGVDGSEAGTRALDAALQLTGYGSTLTVVHVAREGETSGSALRDARDRVRRRHVIATYLERIGDPARELLDAARELETELVVVGRRALVENGEPAPGSVSAAVVRRAPCDVLVVT